MTRFTIICGLVLLLFRSVCALEMDYEWQLDETRLLQATGNSLIGDSLDRQATDRNVTDFVLLPRGYAVNSFRILSEDWQVVGVVANSNTCLIDSLDIRPQAPDSVVDVSSGRCMGFDVAMVSIHPFQMQGDTLSLLRGLSLKLVLELSHQDLEVTRRSQIADSQIRKVLDMLTHDQPVNDYRIESYDSYVTTKPSQEGSVVDCVIITADSLRVEFERLAAFHNSLGIRTVVRDIDWIMATYGGVDPCARVREFIRDAYENWGTIYVLLGGDPEIVPIRVLDYPAMRSLIGVSSIASDVYYSNLDGTWNADGDDVIGEFGPLASDYPDRFPDVFVGRAAVGSQSEARIFVDKTMHYMRGDNPGIWQRTVVALAQQLFEYFDGAAYSETILEGFPPTFRKIRIYENFEDYPGAIPETGANALAYIDSGCNIVSHIGHGDQLRLDLGTEFLERFQIRSLSNDTAFCFIYMMNCSASDPRVESVAKAFLKDSDGGAFAVLGNSALAFPSTGLAMEESFFRIIFSEGRPTIGAASAIYRVPYLWADDLARWWMYLR